MPLTIIWFADAGHHPDVASFADMLAELRRTIIAGPRPPDAPVALRASRSRGYSGGVRLLISRWVAVAVVALGAGCGSSDASSGVDLEPRQVVERYFDALSKGEGQLACSLLSVNGRKAVKQRAVDDEFPEEEESCAENLSFPEDDQDREDFAGAVITSDTKSQEGTITVGVDEPRSAPYEINLETIDGEWKIDSFSWPDGSGEEGAGSDVDEDDGLDSAEGAVQADDVVPETAADTQAENAPAQLVGQLPLAPVEALEGDETAGGLAGMVVKGKALQLVVRARLPVNAKMEAYEVWFYNSDEDSLSAGAQVADPKGVLSGAQELPEGYAKYKFIDISREPVNGPEEHSGDSVLRGSFADFQAADPKE